MAHGNDVIHNNHFRKHWQNRVRTWFNQPARKLRRRKARAAKALRVAPRPTAGLLRPIVSCQTIRYNMKRRAGRGFTLEELKRAGIAKKHARSIGIAVDHRRNNRSLEGLNRNVARLKKYQSKLIVLPRQAKQSDIEKLKQHTGPLMKITQRSKVVKPHVPTAAEKNFKPFHAMRQHRANANLVGKRLRLKNAEA